MSEKGMALLEEFMALEPEERRQLAEELYARVHDAEDDAEWEQEGIRLAEERLAQLKRGEATLIPVEEVLAALRR